MEPKSGSLDTKMETPVYTAEQVAGMFKGVTVEMVKAQYAKNAKQLRESEQKAKDSKNGKYRGFSTEWYRESAETYEKRAK
jgi:hypothetical protein